MGDNEIDNEFLWGCLAIPFAVMTGVIMLAAGILLFLNIIDLF